MTRTAKAAAEEEDESPATGPRFPNAPDWTEFPKLKKLRADVLMEKAARLKREIAEKTQELADTTALILPKLEVAITDPDVKTINYGGVGFQRTAGGFRSGRLDTKWAKRTLLQKGVPPEQIAAHTSKGTESAPGLKIFLPGETKKPWESDDE